jgi:tight adherence protein B
MMRAGLPLRPSEYLALMLICVALFGLVGAVLTRQFAMTILMGLVGFLIPVAWVSSRQAERKRKFEEQLPDALTLIVSSLRSGFSFLRAMQEVSDELPPPMAEEFAWALQEANLGVATGLVLERMAARIRSYDLGLIVTAICIHLEVGGNLAELLETINETIRERVRVQGEIQSLTAEGKLSGVVLILVPIVIGIMINLRDPDYLKPLFTTPIGLCLLAGAVVGQVVGAMIIKKQVALDV